jgi:hypothetical protein
MQNNEWDLNDDGKPVRIGIGVYDDRLSAVGLHLDGRRTDVVVPISSGIEAPLDRLLARFPTSPGDAVDSIAFDLSTVLRRAGDAPLTVVRIAPRPPVERTDEPHVGTAPILHVRGGHTTLGDELAPFDARGFRTAAAGIPGGSRVVITSVGSFANPAHELAAGEILLEHGGPLSVTFSHSFDSNSFATRERTAELNSAMSADAEALTTSLSLISGRRFPGARLSVTRNDGGRVPLSRLAAAPVHSALSGPAIEFVGGASFCGLTEGDLILATASGPILGTMRDEVPAVVPQLRWNGARLATQAAHLVPATRILLHGRVPAPRLVAAVGAELDEGLDDHGAVGADTDLRALGAAVAPLSDWALGVVRAGNATEMAHELRAAEARVHARLVAFGALPSMVRIVESRLVATTYEHARVVSVRVHGVAAEPTGEGAHDAVER